MLKAHHLANATIGIVDDDPVSQMVTQELFLGKGATKTMHANAKLLSCIMLCNLFFLQNVVLLSTQYFNLTEVSALLAVHF